MTTFVDFVPSTTTNFQFQATLDGNIYVVFVTWNLFGQRYYLEIYDLSNNLVVSLPQIGSPLDYDINLVAGYFTTSTLVWRVQNNQFEITP
jgi:hypothetical protein